MSPRRFAASVMLASLLLLAPATAQGSEPAEQRADITITGNSQFTTANGVRSGRGTTADPYVISGWDVGSIRITDTTRAVRIEDNRIRSRLVLNYAGPRVVVRRNDIGDLRLNENIARWGPPTGGRIARNTIGSVSQIRHFDGRFVHNTVGTAGGFPNWPFSTRAVNFDGFNGARFAHNVIYGFMEARLHGHHHSSGFGEHSHMHAGDSQDMVDHGDRWHQVTIAHNRIVTNDPYALKYLDTNHAANDGTAASETNPSLNDPHVHHTLVRIRHNELVGGGLLVNVFNAKHARHLRLAPGSLRIVGNTVRLEHGWLYPFEARYGIQISDARRLALRIVDNEVHGPAPSLPTDLMQDQEIYGAGLLLDQIGRASVEIRGLHVSNRWYGIRAQRMPGNVHWSIERLSTNGVKEPVAYDGSVENEPHRG